MEVVENKDSTSHISTAMSKSLWNGVIFEDFVWL
jgi:hypothetical protein